MVIKIDNDWNIFIEDELKKEYYKKLRNKLIYECNNFTIYPYKYDIFNAFHYTSFSNTKVVIIGQDPYHGPDQAHGLCFSVKPQVKVPPSLMNIYKELKNDLQCCIPNNGYLKKWAQQGVLMLNAVLTVRAGQPASHKNIGWECFTNNLIKHLNNRKKPIVFILWGKFAQSKENLITNDDHLIIKSPHPSPLSANRGFFGSKPFSRTNTFLSSCGIDPIDWQIENV